MFSGPFAAGTEISAEVVAPLLANPPQLRVDGQLSRPGPLTYEDGADSDFDDLEHDADRAADRQLGTGKSSSIENSLGRQGPGTVAVSVVQYARMEDLWLEHGWQLACFVLACSRPRPGRCLGAR